MDKQTFDYSYRDFLKYFNDIKVIRLIVCINKGNAIAIIAIIMGANISLTIEMLSDEFKTLLLILPICQLVTDKLKVSITNQ